MIDANLANRIKNKISTASISILFSSISVKDLKLNNIYKSH